MVVSCSRWSREGLPIYHFWSQILKLSIFWLTWLCLKMKNTSQNLAFKMFFSVWRSWLWKNIVWAAYSLQISSDGSLWPCRVQRILQWFYCCRKNFNVYNKKQMYVWWMYCLCHVVAPAILQSFVPLRSPRDCRVVLAVSYCITAKCSFSAACLSWEAFDKLRCCVVSEFLCSHLSCRTLHDWVASLVN